jgi:hypothetical protein
MTAEIIQFPRPAVIKHIYDIRNRNEALGIIVPKILGLIWERGQLLDCCDRSATAVNDSETVGVLVLWDGCTADNDRHFFKITAYTVLDKTSLSLRVTTQPARRDLFPYLGYRCAIVSWKRGSWEDLIVDENVQPRSIDQLADSNQVAPRAVAVTKA